MCRRPADKYLGLVLIGKQDTLIGSSGRMEDRKLHFDVENAVHFVLGSSIN